MGTICKQLLKLQGSTSYPPAEAPTWVPHVFTVGFKEPSGK